VSAEPRGRAELLATCRLQFHPEFTFTDAERIAPFVIGVFPTTAMVLSAGRWTNLQAGEHLATLADDDGVPVAEPLARFPGALLASEAA
jgi:maltooligosyltrehalose synthase